MTFSESLGFSSSPELHQLLQAFIETSSDIKSIKEELLTGVNYSYVNWNTNPALIKIGFTTNLPQRGKAHKSRGYQHVDHVTGSQGNEKRLKKLLGQRGFRPVSGDETYLLNETLLKALIELDWPVGDLSDQLVSEGIQTNLDLKDEL